MKGIFQNQWNGKLVYSILMQLGWHLAPMTHLLSLISNALCSPATFEQKEPMPLNSKTHIAFLHHSFSISWTFRIVLRHAMATLGNSACMLHVLADLITQIQNRQFLNKWVCVYTSLSFYFAVPSSWKY